MNLKEFNMEKIEKGNIIVNIGKENSSCIRKLLDFIPNGIFIHEEFNKEVFENIIRKQIQEKISGYKAPNIFIIMDHMKSDWTRENVMKEIFMNGRLYNIFYLLTLQKPIYLPPHLSSQIDYIFFNDPENIKSCYDFYGKAIPTYEMFCNILDKYGSFTIKDDIFYFNRLEHIKH